MSPALLENNVAGKQQLTKKIQSLNVIFSIFLGGNMN